MMQKYTLKEIVYEEKNEFVWWRGKAGDLSWGELIFLTSALVEIGYGRDER